MSQIGEKTEKCGIHNGRNTEMMGDKAHIFNNDILCCPTLLQLYDGSSAEQLQVVFSNPDDCILDVQHGAGIKITGAEISRQQSLFRFLNP